MRIHVAVCWVIRRCSLIGGYQVEEERTSFVVIAAKKIRWKCPTKEINSKNKDVPKGTEDKVYGAVVSPIISVA
jgi:hypothetical protein